jgi:LacI family transcriptional regulator
MNDVARRAGVSLATVSAVINRSAYVSPELTSRVNNAAAALDYRINVLARSLKQGATQTAGMLVPAFATPDPFFSEVVQGAEITLRASNYSLLVGQTHNQVAEQSRHIASFRARLIDGLLLFQAAGEDPELDRLLTEKKPVVFVGRVPSGIDADVAATDIEAGTYMGVKHLLQKGHRRVALITQRDSLSVREFRLKAWRRAYADLGLRPASGLRAEGELSSEGGFAAAAELLTADKLPDAIFVDDLVLTIGVVRALQQKNLTGKVEVLSSDDAEWLDVFHIPISTIVQPSHEVGATAARLMLERLKAPDRPYEKILLKPTLKVRQGDS